MVNEFVEAEGQFMPVNRKILPDAAIITRQILPDAGVQICKSSELVYCGEKK